MFVAAFDDRAKMPNYFISFIQNTTAFCDLYLISPAKKLPSGGKLNSRLHRFEFQSIDPVCLPKYQDVKQLFDNIFVNYSTNSDAFERACFHRWFALNALTTSLSDNEYVCLLDTDFLLGMNPFDVLSQCLLRTGSKGIQLIADWDGDEPVAIRPEITIMTKSFLYGFCDYLLTTYFSPPMKSQLLKEYFERIGNGLPGGICDMRALAAYSKLNYSSAFNLRELDSPLIIGNFNSFLNSETGKTDDWKILFQSDRQILQVADESKQLIGTHFQGNAKVYIRRACGTSGIGGEITRGICAEHLESLAKKAKAQTFIHRAASKLKRETHRLVLSTH
jgi:hypothetical protein